MADCLVFKKDGSVVNLHVTVKSDELRFANVETGEVDVYEVHEFTKSNLGTHEVSVFQIAYITEPTIDAIKQAIVDLRAIPFATNERV